MGLKQAARPFAAEPSTLLSPGLTGIAWSGLRFDHRERTPIHPVGALTDRRTPKETR